MYPLLLKGMLKSKVWGGVNLTAYGKALSNEPVGESWEVACHANGDSTVTNGDYKDQSLCQVFKEHKEEIMGHHQVQGDFPVIVKLIDAQEDLSIQVHPKDHLENNRVIPGKTEAWYILDAKPGAEIVLGTKSCSVDEVLDTVSHGDIYTCLKHIRVKSGDVFHVPAGTVHAIGKGIVLLEVQQNSDVTYRLFDYNRNRELHLEESAQHLCLDESSGKIEGIKLAQQGAYVTQFIRDKYFTLDILEVYGLHKHVSEDEMCYMYTCIEGEGYVVGDGTAVEIKKGMTVLVPASMKKYYLSGRMKLVRTSAGCSDVYH
jgi:mannose-6-phosphate isomerase